MNIKKYVLFAVPALLLTLCVSAQFTEKRAKRGPSMNSLRETCCQKIGDVLRSASQALCSIGSFQADALGVIEGFVENDKEGWCRTASRETVSQCVERLEQLEKTLEKIRAECDAIQKLIGTSQK